MSDEDVVVSVNNGGAYKSKFPEGCTKLCNLFFTMRPGIPGVRHQFINGYLFQFLCVHLHSLSGLQESFHHVVLWIEPAVFGRAVFLDDLKDFIPQAACLIHVVDANVDEG